MMEKHKKPIIRHCFNCKNGCAKGVFAPKYGYCDTRYITVKHPRLRAIFCKYFYSKEV